MPGEQILKIIEALSNISDGVRVGYVWEHTIHTVVVQFARIHTAPLTDRNTFSSPSQ
jgi:hypothetical protein